MTANVHTHLSSHSALPLDKFYPISYLVVLKRIFAWVIGLGVLLFLVLTADLNLNAYIDDQKLLQGVRSALGVTLQIATVAFVLKLSYEILHRLCYHYSIEGRHLVISKGIILKSRGAFPLARITDVYLDRDFGDLLLNLYSLHLSTPTIYSGQFARVDGLAKDVATALQSYLSLLLEGSQLTEEEALNGFENFGSLSHSGSPLIAPSKAVKRQELSALKVFVQ